MTYIIKCPVCGFEFEITCDETAFDEIKDEISKCPCGAMADVEVKK